MTRSTSVPRALLAVMLVVLMSTSGWPTASATHVNDGAEAPAPSGFVPPTGRNEVDGPLGDAAERGDAAAATANAAIDDAFSDGPQIPATYYHDLFDGDRIGGWGVWHPESLREADYGTGWQQTDAMPGSGEPGWYFGDRHSYAIHQQHELTSYLVSPRISLDALPADSPAGRHDLAGSNQVDVPGATITPRTSGMTYADNITLAINHRYHFACSEMDVPEIAYQFALGVNPPTRYPLCDGTRSQWGTPTPGGSAFCFVGVGECPLIRHSNQQATGIDSAGVIAFLDTPPTRLDLLSPSLRGQFLRHGESQPPPGCQNCPASASATMFTGQRSEFYQTTYDLTQFAGRDVWLVFQATTAATTQTTQHFFDQDNFDLDLPFRGWQIDQVVLEGPAHPHNVKVDEVLHPTAQDGDGRYLIAPLDDRKSINDPGQQEVPGMVVLNRGQWTEPVRPTLFVTDFSGDTDEFPLPEESLRPGETREFRFPDALRAMGEGNHTMRFEAVLPVVPDAYPSDNAVTLPVQVDRDPDVDLRTLIVTPRTGDRNLIRAATAVLVNEGHGRETVQLDLTVEYVDPITKMPTAPPPGYVIVNPPAMPVILDAGEQREVQWDVTLAKPGEYRLILDGTVEAPAEYAVAPLHAVAEAATLVSAGSIYRTTFTGDEEGISWTATHTGDTRPPCEDGDWDDDPEERVCPDKVYDMRSYCGDRCKTLVAFVDTEDPELSQWPPETPIESLRVEVTHWFDDPGFGDADAHRIELWARDDIGLSHGNPSDQGGDDAINAGTPCSRVNSVFVGEVIGCPTADSTTVLWDVRHRGAPSVPQTELTNRLNHYTGQWIKEEFTVDVHDHSDEWLQDEWDASFRSNSPVSSATTNPHPLKGQAPSTLPLKAFDDNLHLRFMGSGHGRDDGSNEGPWNRCTEWTDSFGIQYVELNEDWVGDKLNEWTCPSWRVARAVVTATTASTGPDDPSREIVLLQWNGRSGETIGQWDTGNQLDRLAGVGHPTGTAWSRRDADTLDPNDDPDGWYKRFDTTGGWHHVDTYGGKPGVWMTAHPDGAAMEGQWKDRPHTLSQLETPPIKIRPDAEAPSLVFDHWFNFLDYDPSSIAGDEVQSDHGTVLMRILDAENEPTTPWLQVAIQYNHSVELNPFDRTQNGLLPQVHRFTGNDCTYYSMDQPCSDRSTDDSRLHRDPTRIPATEAIPLDRIPILDYRRVHAPSSGGMHTTSTTYPDPNEAEPDLQALRLIDLRDGTVAWQYEGNEDLEEPVCDDGVCNVQFAFRMRTGPRSATDHAENGPLGWAISRFEVQAEDALAHDVAIKDLTLHTSGYDWTDDSIGIGPGDVATLDVTLQNEGLFSQPPTAGAKILVDVIRQRADDGSFTNTTHEAPPAFFLSGRRLAPSDPDARTDTLSIELDMPEDPGLYRFLVKARLAGKLDHLDLTDEDGAFNATGAPVEASDNCASLRSSGASALGACSIVEAETVSVKATERLAIEVDVNPISGRYGPGFERQVPITIHNEGNVVVEDFLVERSIRYQDETKDPTRESRWVVSRSPEVGKSATLITLLSNTVVDGLPYQFRPDDYKVRFDNPGLYSISVGITGTSIEDTLLIETQDTFYATTITQDVVPDVPAATIGELGPENTSGPWNRITATGPDGDSQGWHFGDADRRTYNDSVDESLLLPIMDLSVASKASLAIEHRYDFESGYDGGRLEYSLDDGATWRPIVSRQGYTDPSGRDTTVYADNPMNSDRNPLNASVAWTGSSDGWRTDEFNLAQVDDLVSDTLLYGFSQEEYSHDRNFHTRTAPRDSPASPLERASYSSTWVHPSDQSCSEDPLQDPLLEHCWYREDVHMGTPRPNPAGYPFHNGEYWWSGAPDDQWLPLDVTLNPFDPKVRPVLSFWRWEDESISSNARFKVGGTLATPANTNNLFQCDAPTPEGWERCTMDLSNEQGGSQTTARVEFGMDFEPDDDASDAYEYAFRARGGIMDNVRLDYIHEDQGPIGSQGFSTTHQAWGDDGDWQSITTIATPPPAWNIATIDDRDEADAKVFLFGDYNDPLGTYVYPTDAHEIMATPIIDLTDAGGETARLEYWESFLFERFIDGRDGFQGGPGDYYEADRRQLMVQVIEPRLDGPSPAPWEPLTDPLTTEDHTSKTDPTCDKNTVTGWCKRVVDLSDYTGKRFRIGFDVQTDSNHKWDTKPYSSSPNCQQLPNIVPAIGCHWAIDDLAIFAETVAGRPMQLRLRAATDGNVGDGGWTIHSIQVTGAAYQKNIALLPDQEATEFVAAEGGTIEWSGQIRNLGAFSAFRVYLRAEVVETSIPSGVQAEQVEPPVITLDRGQGPSEGLIALPNLLFAGSLSDRVGYQMKVTVPEGTANNVTYTILADLVRKDASGEVIPLAGGDENLGDHRRTIHVTAFTQKDLGLSTVGAISPLTVDSGNPVNITVQVTNDGTVPASIASMRFRVLNATTGAPVADSGPIAQALLGQSILPGDVQPVPWQWTPTEGLHQGFYRIDALSQWSYQGASNPWLPVGLVLVDQQPIYYQEPFQADSLDESGWLSSQRCGSPQADCWRLRHDIAFAGDHSVYIGPLDLANGMHNPLQDVRLDGPAIDLTALGLIDDEPAFRDSPFNPSLTFQYQANLGDNDGVVVQALRTDMESEEARYLGSPDYSGSLTGGGTGNAMVQSGIGNIPDPAAAFTDARLGDWRAVSVPLGPGEGKTAGDTPLETDDFALVGHPVSLSFRFGSSLTGQRGQTFTLDAVTVSSYSSDVAPTHDNVVLTTGADKVFAFRVENNGPAEDEFTIRIDDQQSQLNVFEATVLNPRMVLSAGESDLALVRVKAPTAADVGGGGSLLLEVVSAGDPNAISTARLDMSFIPTKLPDLRMELIPPDSHSTGIVAGTGTSVLAKVINQATKAESTPTTVVVGVCPWSTGIPTEDLATCRTEGTWVELARPSMPGLDPGESWSAPVEWHIPEGLTGRVHIIAEADPDVLTRDSDRSNNLHAVTLDITPLDRPHMRVVPGSLQVLRGSVPVHQALAGELLTITGQVENIGSMDAQNVVVRLKNQVPLLTKTLERVSPGDPPIAFTTQWVAEPGNWIPALEIIPDLDEIQADDSGLTATWDLAVERGEVFMAIDPNHMHLHPGESEQSFLRITNGRSADTTFVIRTNEPEGVTFSGLPARLQVPARGIEEIPIEIHASPFSSEADHALEVTLHIDPVGAPVATAEASVQVSVLRPVTLQVDPVTTTAGTVQINVQATNHGADVATIRIQPDSPLGWDITTPAAFHLEPQATRTIQILATVPAGTPPGEHGIPLTVDGVQRATAIVEVLPAPKWNTEILQAIEDANGTTAWVRVQNIGNAPGLPLIEILGEGQPSRVDPPLRVLDPAESQVHAILVPTDASLLLPDSEVPMASIQSNETAGIQIVDYDIPFQTEGPMSAGETLHVRVELLNSGSTSDPDHPVVLYVNGFPAAETRVSLSAGGTAQADLSWKVRPGEYVLSVSHGEVVEQTAVNEVIFVEGEGTARNLDGEEKEAPSIPATIVLAAIAALVVLVRRRRP